MASPAYRNGSPASRRSTPSRSTPSGSRRVNGFHSPFRDSLNGSPSLQVLEDYGRVYASKERNLKRALDEQTTEQAAKHFKALDDGLKEHQRVRESAERTLEYIILENEREARRKAEEEQRRIEEARRRLEQQKEDEQRRKVEDEKQRQEEDRRREELRKQQDEQAQKRAAEETQQRERQQAQQKQLQDREEKDRKAREEDEAKQRELQAQKEKEAAAQASASAQQQGSAPAPSQPPAATPGSYPPGFVSTPEEIEQTHQKYLDLHRRLKVFREEFIGNLAQTDPDKKKEVNDWRRKITKHIGWLQKLDDAETKQKNLNQLRVICGILDAAAQSPQPTVNIADYLVVNNQPSDKSTQGSATLLFLLHHFAKSIIKQILAEVSMDPATANPIGILTASVFSRPQYTLNGQPLIDLLWAKFHRVAPVLFGICGDEGTEQGKVRMGWVHCSKMLQPDQFWLNQRGLGVGFANITLRSFAKSKNPNPAPNRIFWQAMARMLNAPPGQAGPTHFEIIKGIIEHCTGKIQAVYGSAAVGLVRQACVVFPARHESVMPGSALGSKVKALKSLPHVVEKKFEVRL